jgi:DNA-binding NarL/FixJ family response regulator
VLLVDDQMLFVESLKIVIGTRARDIEIVGIAHNGQEAIACIEKELPHIVLMDVRMPVLDGVEATRYIHEKYPQIRIIMLTTFDDDEYVHSALHHGAMGYLLKDILPSELIAAIRATNEGAAMISPAIISKLVDRMSAHPPEPAGAPAKEGHPPHLLQALSRREIEIYQLLSEGYDNKQIAERLYIAEQTVRNHVSAIYSKIGVHSRVQVMRMRR